MYYNDGSNPKGSGTMKRLVSTIAAVVVLGSAPAFAQTWGSYMVQTQGQGQYAKKKGQGEYKGGGKDYRREKGGPPPRRDERHQGRMTDEQRRDLHRDLDRANREIYRRNSGW